MYHIEIKFGPHSCPQDRYPIKWKFVFDNWQEGKAWGDALNEQWGKEDNYVCRL
jgi:hypothetical protein